MPFVLLISTGLLFAFSLRATAQQATAAPVGAKPKNNQVLAPPGSPHTITNKDGSTTTTSGWGLVGTKAVTTNSKGDIVSTVYKSPTPAGGQSITVEASDVSVTQQTDKQGTVSSLVKMDALTKTKTVLDYDADGQLVKASIFVARPDGGEKPQQVYEAKGPSGGPERYNEGTNQFERIYKSDWESIISRLNATATDIKSLIDRFAMEPVDDDLAEARAEAARHPMTMPKESGPLAPPSDPFEVREQAQREAEKQLDPCLIGTWRSISVEVTLLNEKEGGEGIVITIKEDHSVTIDYTAMTPMRGGNAKNVWKGIASGHMWASKGRGGITSVEQAEAYLMTNGQRNPQGNYKDLGPAKITRYECNETTLVTESVTHKITYTRQKE